MSLIKIIINEIFKDQIDRFHSKIVGAIQAISFYSFLKQLTTIFLCLALFSIINFSVVYLYTDLVSWSLYSKLLISNIIIGLLAMGFIAYLTKKSKKLMSQSENLASAEKTREEIISLLTPLAEMIPSRNKDKFEKIDKNLMNVAVALEALNEKIDQSSTLQ